MDFPTIVINTKTKTKMFSNLRNGSQLFVFHVSSSTPFVEVGTVESIVNSNPMASFYPNLPMYPVDITLRIGDRAANYQRLPANAESASVTEKTSGETVIIATSKDAINAELQSERQKSLDVVNSKDYHIRRISAIDEQIARLNPEVVEQAKQQEEINRMKKQMEGMSQNIEDLLAQNKELMEQLKGERASSLKKKGE